MIKNFINYVEVRTKITSIFAFLMSIAYLAYVGCSINWKLTGLFFISMFLFDLTTTAINNYIDSKAHPEHLPFSRKTGLAIILILLGISAGCGLYLAFCTDIVVFLIGCVCFACGVLYTFGPIPISRLPFGEIMSGIFYGAFIPFLLLYMNMPKGTYLTLALQDGTLMVRLEILPLITIILLAILPTCATANIMLANNICDVEQDVRVNRFTLPFYLGKHALTVFEAIYLVTYPVVLLMVVVKILSPLSLLYFVTFPFVRKNIKTFKKEQVKSKTFVISIKNYLLIMGSHTLLLAIAAILR